MPASWWAAEIRDAYHGVADLRLSVGSWITHIDGSAPRRPTFWYQEPPVSLTDRVQEWLGRGKEARKEKVPPLYISVYSDVRGESPLTAAGKQGKKHRLNGADWSVTSSP